MGRKPVCVTQGGTLKRQTCHRGIGDDILQPATNASMFSYLMAVAQSHASFDDCLHRARCSGQADAVLCQFVGNNGKHSSNNSNGQTHIAIAKLCQVVVFQKAILKGEVGFLSLQSQRTVGVGWGAAAGEQQTGNVCNNVLECSERVRRQGPNTSHKQTDRQTANKHCNGCAQRMRASMQARTSKQEIRG